MDRDEDARLTAFRRQKRIISLLSAAQTAGLAPMPLTHFHSFAYLANVLSPVWSMSPLDAKVLKLKHGPYYPDLQSDVDRLVGLSVILISEIEYSIDTERGGRRLLARITLNPEIGPRLMRSLRLFEEERLLQIYLNELALAIATLTDDEFDQATSEDATYGNGFVSYDDVVDFAGHRGRNFSANAAKYLGSLSNVGKAISQGEQLHLYVRHMKERLQRAQ